MKVLFLSLIICFLAFHAKSGSTQECERGIEYGWLNTESAVVAADDDDFKLLIELSGKGGSFRNYTAPHISRVFARDFEIFSDSNDTEKFCDTPKLEDVEKFRKMMMASGFNVGIYDVRAMIEMALIYDQDYLIKSGYFADYKRVFELILLFFSNEKASPTKAQKVYSKKFYEFLSIHYEFRELFLEKLNPNIIVWNRFQKLEGDLLINKAGRQHEKKYTDFMFNFLKQVHAQEQEVDHGMNRPAQFNSSSVSIGNESIEAQDIVYINPDLVDFYHLKSYKDKFKINEEQLIREIIGMTHKNGSASLGEIVTLLEKQRLLNTKKK